MKANGVKYLRRHWLWLLVNLVLLGFVIRMGMMLSDIPSGKGWVLFAANAGPGGEVVKFSGMMALILLVLSLACTPLARLLRWNKAITVRKSLGLWGFGFACFHMLFYVGNTELLSNPEAWQRIGRSLLFGWEPFFWGKVPYARAGYFALILLIPLALTSNRWSMKRLGKGWKWLHSLVYLAIPVAVWHYWWKEKIEGAWGLPMGGRTTDDMDQVYVFATVVGLLLLVRIPFVRRFLTGFRKRSGQRQQEQTAASN